MKKSLLLASAMLAVGFGMRAEEVDITPSGYDFNNLESFSFAYIQEGGSGANPQGDSAWEACGGDAKWDNGLAGLILFNGQSSNVIPGVSLVSIGGEIGKVWCLAGPKSTAAEKLAAHDVEVEIPTMPSSLGWQPFFNMRWFLDCTGGENKYATGTLRARMLVNVCSSVTTPSVLKVYFTSDGNLAAGEKTGDAYPIQGADFLTDGEWDPTKWQVFEVTIPCGDAWYNSLKIEFPNTYGGADQTVFIKELKFFHDPDGVATEPVWKNTEYETHLLTGGTDGVESIASEEALAYTIDGRNVTFAESASVFTASGALAATAVAGETVALQPGFYVAASAGKSVKFVIR